MRKHFSAYIEQLVEHEQDIVFVTGDLGYAALENLETKMGSRFINAGVAEQNMIGMSAGMASQGFRVMCYSIAPFIVYRCLEQIRNDMCFHNMPVYLVGNGGGYGYGIMGSSHHAIEDIGVLSGLPNMQCYVPAFIEDMKSCIDSMIAGRRPSYFRMGQGKNMPDYLHLTSYGAASAENNKAELTIIVQGPVANNLVAALKVHEQRAKVDIFVISRMPVIDLPGEVLESVGRTKKVLTIEEHISIGGLGSAVSLLLNEHSIPVNKFISLRAEGYPNGLYGSQAYHQEVSGLDEGNISRIINEYFQAS